MSQKESDKAGDDVAASEPELHKAPSMLWFAIPLGLIVLYALLSS